MDNIMQHVYDVARDFGIKGTGDIKRHEDDIITLVRNVPFLYDGTGQKMADRDVAWQAISDVLKIDKNKLKAKWKALREGYWRRSVYEHRRNEPIVKKMAFIDVGEKYKQTQPVVRHSQSEESSENVTIIIEPKEETGDYLSDNAIEALNEYDPLNNVEEISLIESHGPGPSSSVKKMKFSKKFASLHRNASVNTQNFDEDLNLSQNSRYTLPQLNAEDLLFAKMIAVELGRIIGDKNKVKVKSEIYKAISDVLDS